MRERDREIKRKRDSMQKETQIGKMMTTATITMIFLKMMKTIDRIVECRG